MSTNNSIEEVKKYYIYVPYDKKKIAEAKKLFAFWDPKEKLWYSKTLQNKDLFEKFPLIENLEIDIKDEDRLFGGNEIFIGPLPKSSPTNKMSSLILPTDWAKLKRMSKKRANEKCEICSCEPKKKGINSFLYFRWDFNFIHKTQKLMRIMNLCETCYKIIMSKKDMIETSNMLIKFGIKPKEAIQIAKEADEFRDRLNSINDWSVDLSILTNSGIEAKLPEKTKYTFYRKTEKDKKDKSYKKKRSYQNSQELGNNLNMQDKKDIANELRFLES